MAEMKISLPSQEMITISGQTIDKLLRAGDGDAALLYLYILKTGGWSTSDEAAKAIGKGVGDVATAMAVLSRLRLIKLDNDTEDETDVSQEELPDGSPADVTTGSPEKPLREIRSYTFEEIKRELMAGSNFSLVVDETQRSLGKILSPDELLRLFGIYDGLRLPPEVILQLITHCISESRLSGGGRAPSMRYIEKAAYVWEREGIFSLDKAEEYIKALDAQRSVRGEIKRILQIKNREFSASEKKYVDGWLAKGFDTDAIAIAYDRTIVKTGMLVWNYMDSIMSSWHSKDIHTKQEIQDKDSKSNRAAAKKSIDAAIEKFGEPNHEDIERMERLLKKIKDE